MYVYNLLYDRWSSLGSGKAGSFMRRDFKMN